MMGDYDYTLHILGIIIIQERGIPINQPVQKNDRGILNTADLGNLNVLCGGFQKRGYPNSWMVFVRENSIYKFILGILTVELYGFNMI